jgi:hypothetical protein
VFLCLILIFAQGQLLLYPSEFSCCGRNEAVLWVEVSSFEHRRHEQPSAIVPPIYGPRCENQHICCVFPLASWTYLPEYCEHRDQRVRHVSRFIRRVAVQDPNQPLTSVANCGIRTFVVIARRLLGCRAARERQRSKPCSERCRRGRAQEKKDVRTLDPGRFCGTRSLHPGRFCGTRETS